MARPSLDEPDLDALIYHGGKRRFEASAAREWLARAECVLVDDWWSEPETSEALANSPPARMVRLHGTEPGKPGRVTGFVLDHALGISSELPSGLPHRDAGGWQPTPLPGRLSDHDIGVQFAITALAWSGIPGTVDISAAGAAATTHRLGLARAELEPAYFQQDPRHGHPFGGVIRCADSRWVDLVMFTEPTWLAVAAWMGHPEWTRDPGFPSREYLNKCGELYQQLLIDWVATVSSDDLAALAARDGVALGVFNAVEETLSDPVWLDHGYSRKVGPSGAVLPQLPFVGMDGISADRAKPGAGTSLAPLSGTVVVDFTVAQAGSHAAWILGQLGAAVIKIEHRDKPDIARLWVPDNLDLSFAFMQPNEGKKSFLVRWDTEEGHALLLRLVAVADVFLTNVRPAVLERIGLDPASLSRVNGRLVFSSISTDGAANPERAKRPGWAPTFGAASGVGRAVTGDSAPPSGTGGWADYAVGNQAAMGTLQALKYGLAGRFVHIDTNAIAALSLLLSDTAATRQGLAVDQAQRSLGPGEGGPVATESDRHNRVGPGEDSPSVPIARGSQRSARDVFEGRAGVDFDPYWYLEPYALLGKARRTVRPPWSVGGVATGTRAEAPWLGEHTESVARELLGMSDGELAEAVARGTMG